MTGPDEDDNSATTTHAKIAVPIVYTSVLYNDELTTTTHDNYFKWEDTCSKEVVLVDVPSSFQTLTLWAGLLVGIFIQFSSLGANYYVTATATVAQGSGSDNHYDTMKTLIFSLLWSLLMSTVGVLWLWLLRTLLITTANHTSNQIGTQHQHQQLLLVLHSLETLAMTGMFTGISVAWMVTDLALRVNDHFFFTSIGTAAIFVFCRQLILKGSRTEHTTPLLSRQCDVELSSFCNDDEDDGPDDCNRHHHDEHIITQGKNHSFRLQCISLCLGSLVGLLIQCSSLGFSFVVQQLYRYEDNFEQQQQEPSIHAMSLIWSLVTSIMAIALLLLLRALLLLTQRYDNDTATASAPAIVLQAECFFAIGAVLGLNSAWVLADYLLALSDSHATTSLCTLAVSIVWCKTVLYCCGRYSSFKRGNYATLSAATAVAAPDDDHDSCKEKAYP